MEVRRYDVVVLGGAFSGACTALLLLRRRPGTRVLVVEKSVAFDRKVGESTSEVAGTFLTRVLGLYDYLAKEHLPKHGLRLWFNGEGNKDFRRCTEIGPFWQVRQPTFQLDRAKLDTHLLKLAGEAGAEILRPAKVTRVQLSEDNGGGHEVEIEGADGAILVKARWVIDASGKAAMLSRQMGLWERLESHPTRSMWARFEGVRTLDGAEALAEHPCWVRSVGAPRGASTNHLMGHGWWCWLIPLSTGEMSLGLTYDPRIFSPPEGGGIAERLLRHVKEHPIGAYMFERAVAVAKDERAYGHLPYFSKQLCADGWGLVGDAAGFMDPLYSQGLDYCSHSIYAISKLVAKSLDGEDVNGEMRRMNKDFSDSYLRWYRSIYHEKYHYLGDAEIMRAIYHADLGAYFFGPARFVHTNPDGAYSSFPYEGYGGAAFAWLMTLYNRRMVVIAKKRLAAGAYGKANLDKKWWIKGGFRPVMGNASWRLLQGLMGWWMCEVKALFLRVPKVAGKEPAEGEGAAGRVEMASLKEGVRTGDAEAAEKGRAAEVAGAARELQGR
jgi:flavin-dependent dehydrogenase